MVLNTFPHACLSSIILFSKVSIKSFAHFVTGLFLWHLSLSFLYILDTDPLLITRWANLHPVCKFVFSFSSQHLHRTKVLIFDKVQFISLCFKVWTFSSMSNSSLSNPNLWIYSSIFSSKIFVVLHFTSRSIVHLS